MFELFNGSSEWKLSKFILQLTLPIKVLVTLCYVQAISTKSFSSKNNTIKGIYYQKRGSFYTRSKKHVMFSYQNIQEYDYIIPTPIIAKMSNY